MFKFADHRSPDSMASRLRRERLAWLLEVLSTIRGPARILDVGGTPGLWVDNRAALPDSLQVTFLNVHQVDTSALPGSISVLGDARRMTQFPDASFDMCFSNSVIEHVGTLYDQLAMAAEVRRVGRGYFVQTPNRYFPLEPHFHVPLWQFLPGPVREVAFRHLNLGWKRRQPDWLLARAEVEQVRLLSADEMGRLFPDATLRLERVGPLVKSIVAMRQPRD